MGIVSVMAKFCVLNMSLLRRVELASVPGLPSLATLIAESVIFSFQFLFCIVEGRPGRSKLL